MKHVPMSSAGNLPTSVKRGKTCGERVSSAGKRATCVKRGKTCARCQARENMNTRPATGQPVFLSLDWKLTFTLLVG